MTAQSSIYEEIASGKVRPRNDITSFMKRVPIFFFVSLLLVSCLLSQTTRIHPTTPTIAPASVVLKPTFPFIPSTTTFIPVPLTPTSTPNVCDPYAADYCISDGQFVFQRPTKRPANTSIDPTYAYASTANGTRDPHHGVEFINKFGTPVYAAGDGVVIFAGPDTTPIFSPWPDFYGNVIVIEHADGLYTLYAHLSKIDVSENQKVSVGDKIGEVGQSGVAIGPHLHFEVRHGNAEDYFSTMNPALWLIPNQGSNGRFGVIQISIVDPEHYLVPHAEFTLQLFANTFQTTSKMYYGMTYASDMLLGSENAVMSDMPVGTYRIAFKYDGQLYERKVEVESGKLTQVVFVVK